MKLLQATLRYVFVRLLTKKHLLAMQRHAIVQVALMRLRLKLSKATLRLAIVQMLILKRLQAV